MKTAIAGTVEIIGKEKTKSFRSAAELLEIMGISRLSGRPSDNNRQPGKIKKTRRINPEQNNRRKK